MVATFLDSVQGCDNSFRFCTRLWQPC